MLPASSPTDHAHRVAARFWGPPYLHALHIWFYMLHERLSCLAVRRLHVGQQSASWISFRTSRLSRTPCRTRRRAMAREADRWTGVILSFCLCERWCCHAWCCHACGLLIILYVFNCHRTFLCTLGLLPARSHGGVASSGCASAAVALSWVSWSHMDLSSLVLHVEVYTARNKKGHAVTTGGLKPLTFVHPQTKTFKAHVDM